MLIQHETCTYLLLVLASVWFVVPMLLLSLLQRFVTEDKLSFHIQKHDLSIESLLNTATLFPGIV